MAMGFGSCLALLLGVWMGQAVRVVSRSKEYNTTCTRASKEYGVDLCVEKFQNRTQGIADFRAMLEDIEDELSWFSHSKKEGRHYVQLAQYIDVPGRDLFQEYSLQFRYRKNTHWRKVGKTDFAVKYKAQLPFSPKPMTASATWSEFAKCKMEENLKYLGCPEKPCVPDGACFEQCGNPGVGVEAEEQAAKIKSNADEAFAQQYTSAAQITKLADISSFFPDIVPYFGMGSEDTPLTVSRTQHRYIYEKVNLKFNDEFKIESSFTLFYKDEDHAVNDGTAAPYMGEWSFKLEGDEFHLAELAAKLTELVGQRTGFC